MDVARQELEVDRNFEMFMARLPDLMRTHQQQHALLKDGAIEDFFGSASEALAAGRSRFRDGIYSIQEVTDQPEDLGFFSHAVDTRIA